MQYKDYRDNIKLSRLGMGVMRLSVKDGNDALIDYERAKHWQCFPRNDEPKSKSTGGFYDHRNLY